MSHKQAKVIRKALRSKGVNVKQASYIETNGRVRYVKLADGTNVKVHTHTEVLADWCGKAKYRQAKRF